MKLLAILAAVIGLFCGALLLFWNLGDGIRFNRAMQDLLEFPVNVFRERDVNDAWGNPYMIVTSSSGTLSQDYVLSRGPDGQTGSLGNDPDDITRWTDPSEWLASMHPTTLVKWFLGLSLILFVGSTSYLCGCQSSAKNKKPNKSEMATPRKPSD